MSKSPLRRPPKNLKTPFPSDFFTPSRTSEPAKNHYLPKISLSHPKNPKNPKTLKIAPTANSPKIIPSDSTSAISKETEEGLKLPFIREKRRFEGEVLEGFKEVREVKEFRFPFVKEEGGERREVKGTNSPINPSTPSHPLPTTSKKPSSSPTTSTPHKTTSLKSIPLSSFPPNPPTQKSHRDKTKTKTKTKNRKTITDESGEELIGEIEKIGSGRKKFREFNSHPKVQFFEEVDEDEETEAERMFDLINENQFEELCELTKDESPFEGPFSHVKEVQENFCHKSNASMVEEIPRGYTLDDIKVKKFQTPMKKSKKMELVVRSESTPFKLSKANPEACAQKTAYFGHDE